MATANTGPLIPRRRLGAAFRELREARGETLQRTAGALMFSPSKLSRIENGLAGEPHPRDVRDLLAHFEVDTAGQSRMESLAEDGRQPGWWQVPPYKLSAQLDAFISFESAAARIRDYSSTVAPGLLQTRAYAREVLRAFLPGLAPDTLEAEVEARLERQVRLRGLPTPPTRWHVMTEPILYRRVGSPAIMHEQLTALIEAFDDPLVELRVIPNSAGLYEGLDLTTATLFEFSAQTDSDVVVIERTRHSEDFHRPATVEKYRGILDRMSAYWLDESASKKYIERARQNWQE